MAGVIRLQTALKRVVPLINKRLISTSKKNSDTISVGSQATQFDKPANNKNWVSYGFDTNVKEGDYNSMHSIFFGSVTLCLVLGGFLLMYMPDYNLRDWAQREAFLELKRREEAGLPLVDPNLIDPGSVTLPSDEELGDTEIII